MLKNSQELRNSYKQEIFSNNKNTDVRLSLNSRQTLEK